MSEEEEKAWDNPWQTGFACKCPACGKTSVYNGVLTLKEVCEVCEFDLGDADPGDGGVVFVIFILGTIATRFALWLSESVGLSLSTIMAISTVLVLGGSIWMLRMFKAILIALQYRHDAHEGILVDEEEDQ